MPPVTSALISRPHTRGTVPDPPTTTQLYLRSHHREEAWPGSIDGLLRAACRSGRSRNLREEMIVLAFWRSENCWAGQLTSDQNECPPMSMPRGRGAVVTALPEPSRVRATRILDGATPRIRHPASPPDQRRVRDDDRQRRDLPPRRNIRHHRLDVCMPAAPMSPGAPAGHPTDGRGLSGFPTGHKGRGEYQQRHGERTFPWKRTGKLFAAIGCLVDLSGPAR